MGLNVLKKNARKRRHLWGTLVIMSCLGAGTAMANPERGGQCTACHQSTTMPATHLPISNMESTQCLSCHQISGDASGATPAPVQTSVQAQDQTTDQDREQEQRRDQNQDQDRVQTQTMIANTGQPRQDHRGQDNDGRGNLAHDGAFDPMSYRLYFGFLSSSDIGQHRSNSLFHGSSDASLYQPGASGGGEEDDTASGNRIHIGVRADYEVDLGDSTSLTYGLRVLRDDFIDEDFNRTTPRLSVRWKTRAGPDMWQVTSYLQRTISGGSPENADADFTEIGATLNYHRTMSQDLTAIANLRVRQRDYTGEMARRNPDYSLSYGLRQSVPEIGVFNYGLSFINRNSPARGQSRYQGPSVFASLDRDVSDTMTIGFSGEIGQRFYDAPRPNATIAREDRYGEIGITLRDTRLTIMSATPEFSCRYNRTSSNFDRFDSNGTYCALMVERRF